MELKVRTSLLYVQYLAKAIWDWHEQMEVTKKIRLKFINAAFEFSLHFYGTR